MAGGKDGAGADTVQILESLYIGTTFAFVLTMGSAAHLNSVQWCMRPGEIF